jgi:transposase
VGFESSESAAAVLGLERFVLLAAVEIDGELHQLVETEAAVVGCSGCGTRALSKGRRRTKVRDLSCAGRPVVVVWAKRLWRCGDADCEVKTWSETSPLIAPRASLTERARVEACERVGRDNHAVAEVGRSLGVGWWTVMNAVRDYGEPLVDDPGRIGAVGGLWLAKEALRFMYAADTMAEAARRFDAFIKEAKSSSVPELHRLAKTMSRWRTEILAHHRSGASNGPTEAVNLLIKQVLRVAHGFRNFDNYRLRLLLHCGVRWQTPAATRIRGRSPRLAA